MARYKSKWKGAVCECGEKVTAREMCARCYRLYDKFGYLPRCMDCGEITGKNTKRGDDRIFRCADCKAAVKETVQALALALTSGRKED